MHPVAQVAIRAATTPADQAAVMPHVPGHAAIEAVVARNLSHPSIVQASQDFLLIIVPCPRQTAQLQHRILKHMLVDQVSINSRAIDVCCPDAP